MIELTESELEQHHKRILGTSRHDPYYACKAWIKYSGGDTRHTNLITAVLSHAEDPANRRVWADEKSLPWLA